MIERIKHINLLQRKESIGLDISISSTDKFSINFVSLTRKGDEIQLIDTKFGLTEFEELLPLQKYNTPVSISFRGKGILSKVIESTKEETDFDFLSKILPNARLDDFYIQKTQLIEGRYFVSVVRKEQIDKLVNDIGNIGINVFNISLGVSCFLELNKVLTLPENFLTDTHEFKIEEGKVVSLKNKNNSISESETVSIGEDLVPVNAMIAYSIAFIYYASEFVDDQVLANSFEELKKEFNFKILYRKLGVILLGFFFLLLIVNYLIFTNLSNKSSYFSSQLLKRNELLQQIEALIAEIQVKEKLVSESGFSNSLSHAFISDRLAFLKPSQVTLERIEINPLAGEFSESEKCIFHMKAIDIQGNSTHSMYLNNWIEKLELENWIKEVQLIEYNHSSRLNRGAFRIKISY